MIAFRDRMARRARLRPASSTPIPTGSRDNINPFDHGSSRYTDIMKTQALRQALNAGKYDAAIGGARRDEEKSRAKERIFSHRNAQHAWDPKNQRPELWRVFNTRLAPGREHARVPALATGPSSTSGPTSTPKSIEIVPLYFAAPAPGGRALGHADHGR